MLYHHFPIGFRFISPVFLNLINSHIILLMSSKHSFVRRTPLRLIQTQSEVITTRTRQRERGFVLDCVNPLLSKMPQYQSDRDYFLKPYVALLFRRVNGKTKQNVNGLQMQCELTMRNRVPKMVGEGEFRQFLARRMNKLHCDIASQTIQSSPVKPIQSPHSSSLSSRCSQFKREHLFDQKSGGFVRKSDA